MNSLFLLLRRQCAWVLVSSLLSSTALAENSHNSQQSSPDSDGEGVAFVLVKDSGFGGLMVSQSADFSRYSNVNFLPTDLSQLAISSKSSGEAARSWRRAPQAELDAISGYIDSVAHSVFADKEAMGLAEQSAPGTLAVQVRLTELFPMMVLPDDAYGGTIGSKQSRGNLGIVQVTAVLVDVEAREMVGIIQDVVTLRASHVKQNTRTAHARLWKSSFEAWMEKLHTTLVQLGEQR